MRKLNRPVLPSELQHAMNQFLKEYPHDPQRSEGNRWCLFKNEQDGVYKAIRSILESNQQGLCAYCETQLSETNRQIEHFVPKELTTSHEEWTINFANYLLACKGNENRYSRDYSDDPSHKANLTCGAIKGNIDPRGKIYSPYELPDEPVIRVIYQEDGIKYVPDETACLRNGIRSEIISDTITHLNLNSPNLMRRRKNVWDDLMEEEETIYGEAGDQITEKLNELKGVFHILCKFLSG